MHPKRKKDPHGKRPTVQSKELDAILKAVWAAGCWAQKCATGHVMVYHPTDMQKKQLVNNTLSNPHLLPTIRRAFARWGISV